MTLLFLLGGCLAWEADKTVAVAQTVYYVSATEGKDTNLGVSPGQAWQTLSKVSNTAFQPGDKILFKRGDIWHETLIIAASGTENSPITYDAYGEGPAPVITGADAVTGWTRYRDNIYVADISLSNVPNQLYVDGTFYDIAHYPNSGWLIATADSNDTTSIINSNLSLEAELIIGATIKVRAVDWKITTLTVKDYDSASNKITLSGNVFKKQLMKAGRGFYFQNKLELLDSPGEWYYDPLARKIYLRMENNANPNTHTVQISTRSHGIKGYDRKYIIIQNMEIKNAITHDINICKADNITVFNLDLSGGWNGIYFSGSNSTIDSNIVQNTLSNGIQVFGSSSCVISDNTVSHAGNVGNQPKTSNAAIYAGGSALRIQGNTVTDSGRSGIAFWGNRNIIQNNTIDRSCLLSDDCAGIYTSSSSHEIRGNIIKNSIGNIAGTFRNHTFSGGIYLDDLSHDINVADNIVDNADFGIFIHTGHSHTITGNTVYKARITGVRINRNTPGAPSGSVYDNVITGNTFESLGTKGVADYYDLLGSDDPAGFGTFDNNRYYHPNSDIAVRSQFKGYSLSDWQKLSGQDLNSTSFSYALSPGEPSLPEGAQ